MVVSTDVIVMAVLATLVQLAALGFAIKTRRSLGPNIVAAVFGLALILMIFSRIFSLLFIVMFEPDDIVEFSGIFWSIMSWVSLVISTLLLVGFWLTSKSYTIIPGKRDRRRRRT